MRSRIKIFTTLLLLGMAFMLVAVGHRNQTLAADYSCRTTTCPGTAQCSGDRWAQSGACEITCYKESGAPGQIVFNGSANCSPPPSGGSGGGSSGGYSGLKGSYCAENWMWDAGCSGPDDTYDPR